MRTTIIAKAKGEITKKAKSLFRLSSWSEHGSGEKATHKLWSKTN